MYFNLKFLVIFISLFALSFSVYNVSSQNRKFTWLKSLDMDSGSVFYAVKYGVKHYFSNIHSTHVEKARRRALETALADAATREMSTREAAFYALQEGIEAAELADKQVQRVIAPIVSSGWDFLEVLYYGGTVAEGFLTGSGTLFGAYGGGFIGEQMLGWFGYFVGSYVGSVVGGIIGLRVHDVVNEVHFLLNFHGEEREVHENAIYIKNVSSYEYDPLDTPPPKVPMSRANLNLYRVLIR